MFIVYLGVDELEINDYVDLCFVFCEIFWLSTVVLARLFNKKPSAK